MEIHPTEVRDPGAIPFSPGGRGWSREGGKPSGRLTLVTSSFSSLFKNSVSETNRIRFTILQCVAN